jgi:hypothetical protein
VVDGPLSGMGKWFGTHGRTIRNLGRLDILFVFMIASAAKTAGTTRTAGQNRGLRFIRLRSKIVLGGFIKRQIFDSKKYRRLVTCGFLSSWIPNPFKPDVLLSLQG